VGNKKTTTGAVAGPEWTGHRVNCPLGNYTISLVFVGRL